MNVRTTLLPHHFPAAWRGDEAFVIGGAIHREGMGVPVVVVGVLPLVFEDADIEEVLAGGEVEAIEDEAQLAFAC